jgi:CheY-like chemotaxis protein
MPRNLLTVAFCLLAVLILRGDLLACGDKFLAISRGTRYQRAALPRSSASILVYATPASSLTRALGTASIEETLRSAGYRLTVVTTAAEFDRVLRQGAWDLVLTDLAEGRAVRSRLPVKPAPIVLPVAFNVTADELKQARKDYQRIVKAPTKKNALLDMIDDVLTMRKAN